MRATKILSIIPQTIVATWFAYKLYQSSQNYFFLDGFILFAIAFVGLLIFIWTIYHDRKEYKTSGKFTSYWPTAVGLLFIFSNTGMYHYLNNKIHSPTLISGFNDGGYNGFSVDFKTNGSYVMANGSGLGQSYFYGTYTIKDSIITIDKSDIDNCIKTNKLAIRTENYYPVDSISKANYITQIDHHGTEINHELRFRVTEDNRTK